MGNSKSKKGHPKDSDMKFFEREKRKEQKRDEKKMKKNANHVSKRTMAKEVPSLAVGGPPLPPAGPGPAPSTPAQIRSYDDEALGRMRFQLHNDSDAFLLNNILLSVQFFENFERETQHVKNNPISDREHMINEAMVRHHKHVFFADQLAETVHEHVLYQRQKGQTQPLVAPRLFIIYDNVEASEPGDMSDYSAVLDAPFYKLRIEDCKEQGYVKLKKIEVLESMLNKENEETKGVNSIFSDDSVYTDSEKESNDSDDVPYITGGQKLLQELESKLAKSNINSEPYPKPKVKLYAPVVEQSGRRRSGPIKQVSTQIEESRISNIHNFKKGITGFQEEKENDTEVRPRKSILKHTKPTSAQIRDIKSKKNVETQRTTTDNVLADDTETSGYRSTSSSRHNESSEAESDYGYATITQSLTPKKVAVTAPSNFTVSSGVLPDECWKTVQTRAINNWSDEDDDEELDDSASKVSLSRNLYETYQYLSSFGFMNNFVDNFIINLGSGLGLGKEAISNALTQGARIYCETLKNGSIMKNEIFPALIAAWPNAANQWIIRERRIIQNPRTNFSYQWPTKYVVSKAIGFGCVLVPVGFRPKRGSNPEQVIQWRIIFPAAERYLESCLAHSHVRCYLFALVLHKTFMESEKSKVATDANHIKNHLFWQCEDNFAKWPEDRLGESLRLFLKTFYVHFGQGRFPNYFIDSCNEFKSIPKPMLLTQQRRLANILEAPVMHMLHALSKLKHTKKDFYPTFNCYKLYDILTCKNPLRIINPNLPAMVSNYKDSSESEDGDNQTNFWENAKSYDKNYQWKKERQRQLQERRKTVNTKRQKASAQPEKQIETNIILPAKMDPERRRLVLEFFITHFIAMARSSERFEAIKQAVIYLEQAQRLCILLQDEVGGDYTANEFLEIVRDKLADCQRKLVNQGGFNLPKRESQLERHVPKPLRKMRPRYENIVSQDSPTDAHGISAFTFVDVHIESTSQDNNNNIRLIDSVCEESKL